MRGLFVLANLGLVFLWGGALAGLSLAVGQFVRKKFLAVLLPFCLCMIADLVFDTGLLVTITEWSPIRLYKGIDFLSMWLFGEDFYTVISTEMFEKVNELEEVSKKKNFGLS